MKPADRPFVSGIACAAAALLLACAAPTAAHASPPPAACCADPSHFPYQPLPLTGTVDFAIDAKSPSFEFQTGISGFRAFTLPAEEHRYVLDIRSFVSDGPDPRRGNVFYPLVAVLTDDFVVSRLTDLYHLRFDMPLLELALAPAYRVVLPFDPANRRERYVVVFTAGELATRRDLPMITTPESAAEAAKIAFLGASRQGHLQITVHSEEPAAPTPTAGEASAER